MNGRIWTDVHFTTSVSNVETKIRAKNDKQVKIKVATALWFLFILQYSLLSIIRRAWSSLKNSRTTNSRNNKFDYFFRNTHIIFVLKNINSISELQNWFKTTYEEGFVLLCFVYSLSLIHIWRCRRSTLCRSRWSPYH